MPELGRGLVGVHDPQALIAQTRRFRQWRPWTWGFLGNLWSYSFEEAGIGWVFGPAYHWKTRKDRQQEKRDQCPRGT